MFLTEKFLPLGGFNCRRELEPVDGRMVGDQATRSDAVGEARVKIDARCLIVARRLATRLLEGHHGRVL